MFGSPKCTSNGNKQQIVLVLGFWSVNYNVGAEVKVEEVEEEEDFFVPLHWSTL